MRKKTLIELALLAVLATVLGFYVCARRGVRMGGTPSPLESRFKTEEDWLLDAIVRDIAEMSAYARNGGGDGLTDDVQISFERVARENDPLPAVSVEATVGDRSPHVSRVLSLEGSFWNPINYARLATDLLGPNAVSKARSMSPDDSSLLKVLLEPRASVLEKENQRISSRLASNMLDPAAHEDAALLLGAFGLREASFRFGDLRPIRCRITAHLAMARALRGNEPYQTNGRFAEAALLALLGRQAETLAALESLSARASPVEWGWVNALYMYATNDWRRPGGNPDSLFEKLHRFRAMAATLGSTAAVERMGKQAYGDPADWGRVVTWLYGGAASDRPFITAQMERELTELQELWTLKHGEPLPPERFADALNQPAGRCLTPEGPQVIGWGTWAAFFQRHICGLISAADQHLRGSLGVPEWAETYGQDVDLLFERLTLYPVVQVRRTRRVGGRVEDTVGMAETIALARRRAELMNVFNWEYMADTAGHMILKWGMPRADAWFSRSILVTSIFDTPVRIRVLRAAVNQQEVVSALRRIAPRHAAVLYLMMEQRKPEELTVEEVAREFGERIDYDLEALDWMRRAAADRPEEERSVLEKMCALDANHCVPLGWALVRAGREEEAVVTFERAVQKAPDRILVCHNSDWLVHRVLAAAVRDGEGGRFVS